MSAVAQVAAQQQLNVVTDENHNTHNGHNSHNNHGGDRSNDKSPPVTPEMDDLAAISSQATVPSTEAPPSPVDPNASFKTEANDDRITSVTVIPSSLTPPPSSQMPTHARNGALPAGPVGSQRPTLFSPPDTALSTAPGNGRLEWGVAADFIPPSAQQVLEASADELRAMVHACVSEHAKLKMEAAHHKLQYNLLSLQADEDAKRAEVEHEMTRREVEALQNTESSRQARREMSAAIQASQLQYIQMKQLYEQAAQENRALKQRLKGAKTLLMEKEDQICTLSEKLDMALTRIHENREHFQMLRSPGGIFHHALTPKQPTITTPQQPTRSSRRQTPRGSQRNTNARADAGHGQGMVALLHVINQDNNSAPSTPVTASRPLPPRNVPRHSRNAQSLSSLPMTPDAKPRGGHAALLPSVHLVPQTEPPHRRSSDDFIPESPPLRRRRSRESTISATEDNEDLARRALESVGGSAALSRARPRRPLPDSSSSSRHVDEEEDVMESQASQAASEMLRRDARQSFEVAASRDATPAPIEKSARLQATLLSGHVKSGAEKRKFNGGLPPPEELRPDHDSPSKRIRIGGDQLRESRLGIQ